MSARTAWPATRPVVDVVADRDLQNALQAAGYGLPESGVPARLWVRPGGWSPNGLDVSRHPVVGATGEVEVVRRDLVVPTVDEIAQSMLADGVAHSPDWELRRDAHSAAVAVHALLLSRIEGDNDTERRRNE